MNGQIPILFQFGQNFLRRFPRRFPQTDRRDIHFPRTYFGFSVYCYGEQATITVICKVDFRPGIQGSLDAGAQPPVGQHSLSRLEKATISEARALTLRISLLNWRRLSSPLVVMAFSSDFSIMPIDTILFCSKRGNTCFDSLACQLDQGITP